MRLEVVGLWIVRDHRVALFDADPYHEGVWLGGRGVRQGRRDILRRALEGDAKPKMFARDPLRWCGYLIAHDAHHRGQILLALKQSGFRLPDKVALNGIWGKWIDGK